MKIKISESKLISAIKTILEQDDNEWVKLTPSEYLELMRYTDYDGNAVSNLRQFRNKKIWITGSLDLRNTKTESLGNVKYVDGTLDVSNSEIKSLQGVQIKGSVFKWNTPIDRAEKKRIRDGKVAEINLKREEKEWDDIEGDEEAMKAQALLEYLESTEDIEIKTEEDKTRLNVLKENLSNLENQMSNLESEGEDTDEIEEQISNIEDEIEKIEQKVDIYNLYPDSSHYDMTQFCVLGTDFPEDHEFAVGTQDEVDRSMNQYFDSLVDEGVENMFNREYLENFIDEYKIEEYARDYYEQDVYENPEIYCNDEDKDLSDSQETEIEDLQNQIDELRQQQEETDDRDEYDKLQDQIDDLDTEIEDIKQNPDGEYKEEKLEQVVEDFVNTATDNPMDFLRDLGYEDRIEDFIDLDRLRDEYISDQGYGVLNSYDGEYSEYNVKGEYFYVMRIN